MAKTHRPPGRNSKISKVLVKPSGPHHVARRSGSSIAAKTADGLAGIVRCVENVVIRGSLKAAFGECLPKPGGPVATARASESRAKQLFITSAIANDDLRFFGKGHH